MKNNEPTQEEKPFKEKAKSSLKVLIVYTCPYCGRDQYDDTHAPSRIKGKKYGNRINFSAGGELFCFDCKGFFPIEEVW